MGIRAIVHFFLIFSLLFLAACQGGGSEEESTTDAVSVSVGGCGIAELEITSPHQSVLIVDGEYTSILNEDENGWHSLQLYFCMATFHEICVDHTPGVDGEVSATPLSQTVRYSGWLIEDGERQLSAYEETKPIPSDGYVCFNVVGLGN